MLGPGIALDPLEADEDSPPTAVDERDAPYPHIRIPGIDGPITGTARLYKERISGGKCEDNARSVGFFINVRGRIIALDDPYFGLENLSHGAWAHFRCTVRADGLDAILNVERDTLRDGPERRLFRSLLRAMFNQARVAYPGLASAAWPNAGELLVRRWDAFPLQDLGDLVTERLGTTITLPGFVDASDVDDLDLFREEWKLIAKERPAELLSEISDDDDAKPDAAMARYHLRSRRLGVNANHPFVREHGATAEEQELIRDLALLDFLGGNKNGPTGH